MDEKVHFTTPDWQKIVGALAHMVWEEYGEGYSLAQIVATWSSASGDTIDLLNDLEEVDVGSWYERVSP